MHRSRFLLSIALAIVNAAILTGIRALADRHGSTAAFAFFLILVTLFCAIEATLVEETPEGTNNLAALATMTGISIFATFIASIAGETTTTYDAIAIASGALLMSGGIALRCIAIYTLGARFVSELRLTPGEPLVRHGVYRWLRHPSEVGLLTLTFGAALLFRSLAALGVWCVAILPLTLIRVHIENAFLNREGIARR